MLSGEIIENGLMQTANYADKCNSDEAHLIAVDQTARKSRDEKAFVLERKVGDRALTVWGM